MYVDRQQLVSGVASLLGRITATDLDTVIRTTELGQAGGFHVVSQELEELQALLQPLQTVDLSALSLSALRTLRNSLQSIVDLFEQLSAYDPLANGNAGERLKLLEKVETTYLEVSASLRPIVLEARLGQTDFSGLREDAEALTASLRLAIAGSAISQHATAFREELRSNRMQAALWLGVSLSLAAGLIFASVHTRISALPGKPTTSQVVTAYASHLIILTLGLTFILLFIKLARSSFAQANINAHRVRALQTFQSFIDASEPGPVRDAVMLETTRAIFSHVESGNTGGDDGAGLAAVLSSMLKK